MRRPPLLPTILTLVSVIILCWLGNWQLQRLHWKQGLLVAVPLASPTAHGAAVRMPPES